MANVALVIVSHSPLVAQGAADMVREMVGDEVYELLVSAVAQRASATVLPHPTLRRRG